MAECQWLKLVQQIKRQPVLNLLTNSQRAAHDVVVRQLLRPGYINLWGGLGAGKTLTAKAIGLSSGLNYLFSPSDLDPTVGEGVIIDNVPAQDREVRQLLGYCHAFKMLKVVLVTDRPTPYCAHQVELGFPTPDDVDMVRRQLLRLQFTCKTEKLPTPPNFWAILQASL